MDPIDASNLKRRAVSATLWSGLGLFAQHGVQLFVTIALARLLSPEDFGTVAVILVFAVVAQVFSDSGFGTALVQKRELGADDASSVFYFNVATGAALALLLAAAGPWIADFYGGEILAPLAAFMALNLFVNTLGSVQTALLTREMRFRLLMRAQVTATAISGAVAIALAWQGFGVWSLAFQLLTSSCVTVFLLWRLSPWRPERRFRPESLRSLFRFGGFMFLSALLDRLYTKISPLLIGKLYSIRDLGFYHRADSTEQLPSSLLSGIVGRVALPAFSAAAGDEALLRKGVHKAITTLTLLSFPAMLGLLASAHALVFTLFGEKWLPAVPFLQVLCLRGLLMPLQVINLNVLMALGHSNLFFRLEVWKKMLGLGVLLVASQFSILAMASGLVAMAFVAFLMNAHYTGVFLGYSAWRQLRDVAGNLLAALAMLSVVWPLALWDAVSPPAMLGLQVAVGVVFYVSACWLFRLPSFLDVLAEARVLLHRARSAGAA
ncbi:MAG: lipopolysaccharide biosynthesis protein [Myxococcota bacterium]|jgi:O-antigen/teichoic acid export membrane protein|nr:lipopolysaccharide biosynthesis protein [Myxococcota bacterium]